MADPVLNTLALCSGIGGLELGVAAAIPSRVLGYVERDAYAAAVLLARMADEALEPAPVWSGDIADFDAAPFVGRVDLVSAGFPCQPWSVAGKRKGADDERWIWPAIVRIVRECEPGYVFLENVPGLYRHGLRLVLSDLASLGFDAEWANFTAADVGAPHLRERVFILGYAERARPQGTRPRVAAGRRFPPGPSEEDGWRDYIGAGGPEPSLRRGASRLPSRMDRLRCLGNAVVPQQAELAFRVLWGRVHG